MLLRGTHASKTSPNGSMTRFASLETLSKRSTISRCLTALRSIDIISFKCCQRSSVNRKLAVGDDKKRGDCASRTQSPSRDPRSFFGRRKTSVTMRQRLTPEIVCATTTRALEKIVLMHFSPTLNSLPLGFFGVAWSGFLPAHTPESPCLCRAWRCVDRRSARHPWPSYRVFCPPRLDSDIRPSLCWY